AHRLLVAVEQVVRVAETVQRGGLTVQVAELLLQGERLPAVREGVGAVTGARVVPADRVEAVGDEGLVAAGPCEVQRVPGLVQRRAGPVLLVEYAGQRQVGTGGADRVVELLGKGDW